MLTNNFSEIVSVFKERINENTLDALSSDEIGNVSLMLRGYLGLIQSGFKTKDDSTLPSSEYYNHLKNLLAKLTSAQFNKLQKTTQSVLDTLITELEYINHQLDSHALINNLNNSKTQKIISEYKKCFSLLNSKLNEYINNPEPELIKSIQTCYEICSKMNEILSKLKKQTSIKDISLFMELLNRSSTTYFKKMTYCYDKEKDNKQCESYVVSSEFMDLLINN